MRGKERLPRYYAASAPRRGARLLRVLLEVLDLPGLVAVHERDLGRVRVAALLELKRYYTYICRVRYLGERGKLVGR